MARKIAVLHYTGKEITETPWIDRLIEQANTWGLEGWKIVGVNVKPNSKGGRTFRYTLEEYEDPTHDEETDEEYEVPEETVRELTDAEYDDPPGDTPPNEPRGKGLVLPPSGLIIPGKGPQ